MKIVFILLSLVISFYPTFSQLSVQPFKINKADSLMREGNVPRAITEYRKLYALYPHDYKIVYNYARALSVDNTIIKQFDSCFKYLNIAISLNASLSALTDPYFIAVREDSRWNEFENKLIGLINNKEIKIKDIEYARVLWKLGAYDQAYFDEIMIAQRKLGMRSSVASAIWKLKSIIQEKNQAELEKIVRVKGWPKVSDVGQEAFMAAYLIAMHTNDGSQKKYLPMIKKSCQEKELPWIRYALIYDRCCFNEKKPQKYGTHTIYNEQTNAEELYLLENDEKVDEWRKEIGLEPLSEYLSKMNIKYIPNVLRPKKPD
jgi:tetratricopeptide (TPR) repeat protein